MAPHGFGKGSVTVNRERSLNIYESRGAFGEMSLRLRSQNKLWHVQHVVVCGSEPKLKDKMLVKHGVTSHSLPVEMRLRSSWAKSCLLSCPLCILLFGFVRLITMDVLGLSSLSLGGRGKMFGRMIIWNRAGWCSFPSDTVWMGM